MTSVNDNEAKNMGRETHTAHDRRYDEADEFMEVVLGHWDSWDDDAIVVDRQTIYTHIPIRFAGSTLKVSSCRRAAPSRFLAPRKGILL